MIPLQGLIYQIYHHSFKVEMTALDSKLALLKTSLMYIYMTDSKSLLVSVMN